MAMSHIASSSIQSAAINMVVALVLRASTFLLNAYILRRLPIEVLGIINVRLTLLVDTILFLAREGFRVACLGHKGPNGWRPVINLMWLSNPLAMLWARIFTYIWVFYLPYPDKEYMSQYQQGIFMMAASCFLEMMGEPVWLVAQVYRFSKLKAFLEFMWLFIRSTILALGVIYQQSEVITIFAFGHMVATLFYVAGYYAAIGYWIKYKNKLPTGNEEEDVDRMPFTSIWDLLPGREDGNYSLDLDQTYLATSFIGQGVTKLLLTEGERYTMTFFNLLSLSEQGIYDVVSNLGSLAARLVFKPIEESAYFYFSQSWKRNVSIEQQDRDKVREVGLNLYRLLRLMVVGGLLIVTYGYSYSHLLLTLYGGEQISSGQGTDLLRSQCLLVLLLAVNGITECFSRAAMSQRQINSHNVRMVLMSLSYLTLSWSLTKWLGPVGFVLANCVNMVLRIYHSLKVIHNAFLKTRERPLAGLFPGFKTFIVLACAGSICHYSEMIIYPRSPEGHVAIGTVMYSITFCFIIHEEQFLWDAAMHYVKKVMKELKKKDKVKKK